MAALTAGCATQQLAPTNASRARILQTAYVLRAGDKIHIDVFGEPDLSSDFEVPVGNAKNPEGGAIKLGPLNQLQVGGKTPSDLEAAITAELANGYLKEPKVSVVMLSYRPVSIFGEVNEAGEIAYKPGMTLLNVVAAARGFTYRANEKVVDIVHFGTTEAEAVPVTAAEPVLPGDVIRVRERGL